MRGLEKWYTIYDGEHGQSKCQPHEHRFEPQNLHGGATGDRHPINGERHQGVPLEMDEIAAALCENHLRANPDGAL